MTITLIVPCYNEQDSIPLFYKEAKRVLEEMHCNYEMLFINDGSVDGTMSILKSLASQDTGVKYISFSRNFGKEAAMYAGFQHSHGDYTAVMDADLQDPPCLLKDMVNILQTEPYDSVATRRINRSGEPPLRSFFARLFYKIINAISDAEIIDGARDFRLMKRNMVDAILSMGEYNRFSKGIFGWVGFRTYWLPYQNVERIAGTTKWSFWKLFGYAMDGIIAYSTAPLMFIAGLGLAGALIAVVALLFVVIRALIFGDPVAGWPSLVSIILFFGGLQLLCMGILAMYISKIYLETKKRPVYIVREKK